MSAILSLSETYGSFYWKCTKFAVSPYTNTFLSIAKSKEDDSVTNLIAASIIVATLTFIVPVLPVISTLTFTLASIGMILAAASMFITYPVAIISDLVNGPSDDNFSLA